MNKKWPTEWSQHKYLDGVKALSRTEAHFPLRSTLLQQRQVPTLVLTFSSPWGTKLDPLYSTAMNNMALSSEDS